MAVTEWNLNSWGGVGKDSKGIEQALYIGEFLGRLIEAGVDAATFWPITMQGNWAQKAFFVEKHLDIQPSQIGFALCSRNLCGQLVRSSSSSDAYYTIASHDSGRNETTLLIYGRPLVEAGEFTEVSVDLSGEAFAGAVCSRIEVYYAAQKQSYSIQRLAPRFEQQGGKLRFMLPRYAMAAVKISHR
jgi:hypothetical protein